jgi:hypothetical protein
MVDTDLFVQVYTSALVLLPTKPNSMRLLLRIAGCIQAGFMVAIALSGNFSFLNHLTIIPALACIDDFFCPQWMQRLVYPRETVASHSRSWRKWFDVLLLLYIAVLSWPVVANLLQLEQRQLMNASFDSFRIMNTYGAFGSVGEARYEPIISVSDDAEHWTELELPCKPGKVTRRPCFCAPYHYRMDWNIWFLGFKPHQAMLRQRESWLFSLLEKLLQPNLSRRPWLNLLDQATARYLTESYYSQDRAPTFAKVDMYHYRMAAPLSKLMAEWWSGSGIIWWKRAYEESLVPVITWDNETEQIRMA